MIESPISVDDLPRPKRRREADDRLEHDEQVAVIDWCKLMRHKWPELDMIFAVPNAARRSKAVAGRLIAEGMKAGVPDLIFPVARCGAIGLAIEMKVNDRDPTNAQKWWLANLPKHGWLTAVCWTANQAIDTLEDYLNGRVEKLGIVWQ